MNYREDNKREISIADAIKIQNNHLAEWKTKLKSNVYDALVIRAQRDNDKAKTGYEIFRGDDMTTFILNYKF